MSARACNLCLLERITKRAADDGMKTTLFPKDGGIDVHVHPANAADPTDEKYLAAWLMSVPKKCAC